MELQNGLQSLMHAKDPCALRLEHQYLLEAQATPRLSVLNSASSHVAAKYAAGLLTQLLALACSKSCTTIAKPIQDVSERSTPLHRLWRSGVAYRKGGISQRAVV